MREIRSSGSVEGVVSDHDPYSDQIWVDLTVRGCQDSERNPRRA